MGGGGGEVKRIGNCMDASYGPKTPRLCYLNVQIEQQRDLRDMCNLNSAINFLL